MTSILPAVYSDVDLTKDQVKARVIASIIALFLAIICNFVLQIIVTFVKKIGKNHAQKKLLQTSQVMHWFGIGTIFAMYPPDMYGASSVGMSYVILIILVALHVFCLFDTSVRKRSLWSIMYVIYILGICFWILIQLILLFLWTSENYSL